MTTPETDTIGVIGGTGPQGRGLAYRFATKAGYAVTLGSRSEERARAAADQLNDRLAGLATVSAATNDKAAQAAGTVLLAVPWAGHGELVTALEEHLAGKIVISCVNPLGFDKRGPYGLTVADGSAAEQAARLLPASRVVGAFHHVSAVNLLGDAERLDGEDVLVCGDDAEAKQHVVELARAVTGRPGLDAGPLRPARQLEPLTAVLISIDKRYRTHSGLQITGIPATARHP